MGRIDLDHIDPKNGVLICGLCNEFNEIVSDSTYNIRKTNRFVPYRVCNYPAPTVFGEEGEFLIGGDWKICEFGGPEWWEESNKIGNACVTSGRRNIKNIPKETLSENARRMNEHPNTVSSRTGTGKKNGPENIKKCIAHPNTREAMSRNGKANGKRNMERFPKEVRSENGRKVISSLNSQVWVSLVDGFKGNKGNVGRHNISLGADKDLRERIS